MPVKVTINMYSGRRNPSFTLTDAAAKKLVDGLSIGRFKKRTTKTTPFPSILGYRGVTIEQGGKKIITDLPDTFHLSHDSLFTDDNVAETKNGNAVESLVFDNLGNLKDAENLKNPKTRLAAGVKEYLDKRDLYIKNYFKYFDKTLAEILAVIRLRACACAPLPDLDTWNALGVQGGNNCYNYSTNYRTDTFAQPGEATGILNTSLSSCNPASGISVKAAAISDGLIDLPTNNNTCPSYGHLVALVIDPNSDYHWFRKGRNGKWSHKPGGTPATILDNSGNPITDPRTADRGGYTDFCTFMQVIHGHFKIK
jgi:hypothetical protein